MTEEYIIHLMEEFDLVIYSKAQISSNLNIHVF